jgi:hypothetical protein
MIVVPAYKSDGSPNFRLAAAGAGEPPVFRLLSSRQAPGGGLQPIDVEAEPLALTMTPSVPQQEPPGLERIAAPLKSAGAWVPGHLVNGSMGGPGTNENLVPIDRTTNAKMRGNYENPIRQKLRLGGYYYFRAHVEYWPAGASPVIGVTRDFVKSIAVDFEEIVKGGTSWTRTGVKGTAGPYSIALPLVSELDPKRVSS